MIRINSASGFTPAELTKLQDALDLANRVMATDDFKRAVLAAEFDSTNDSSVEIYQRLTGQDWAVDFSIVTPPWYKRWFSKEVAHENPDGSVVLDRNKFAGEDLPSLCGTTLHEACHVAGFSHPFNECLERDNSVPYEIGNIAEKIAREPNASR